MRATVSGSGSVSGGGGFTGSNYQVTVNSGSFNASGVYGYSQDLGSNPVSGTPGNGTVTISAPTIGGNEATYTVSLTLPFSLGQQVSSNPSITVNGSATEHATTATFTYTTATTLYFNASGTWDNWSTALGQAFQPAPKLGLGQRRQRRLRRHGQCIHNSVEQPLG